MDIGCSIGIMTEYLAHKVGSAGRRYAIDMSQKQLDIMKERLTKKILTMLLYFRVIYTHIIKLCTPKLT